MDYRPAGAYNEDMFVAMQLDLAAGQVLKARDLPPIPYSKKDKYGAPYYRAWAPDDEGGYPGEDHVVVLVEHYDYLDDLEKKSSSSSPSSKSSKMTTMMMEYAHIKDINRMMLNPDARWKEVPASIKYGTHLMFVEDPKLREKRILMEERLRVQEALLLAEAAANPGEGKCAKKQQKKVKPLQRQGSFRIIWRRNYSDPAGYDTFMAKLGANLPLRQWADW